MEIIDIKKQEGGKAGEAFVQTIFERHTAQTVKFSFGTALFPAGARVPAQGSGSHEGDEYSLILKGEIHTSACGVEARVRQGQASFIPAGETHWAKNVSNDDCEIVWVLIEEVA